MPKKKIIDLNDPSPKKKNHKVPKPAAVKSKIFADAPGEHYFGLCDGQQIKNIRMLADCLESVDDGVFYHHVNSERNDFATWINDIFGEEALAAELQNVKDKGNTRIILYRYLLNSLAPRM